MKSSKWIALGAVVMLATACGSDATPGGGGTYTATDTQGGTGSDGGGGGGNKAGDDTKNKADLKVTDDKNASVDIKAEKPADKGDVTSKAWGATNTDKVLNLFITEADSSGNSIVINAFINTEKYPLPATDIPLGAPDSDAWVSYVAAGAVTGSFSSKDKGTISVSSCPENGKALVGTLKGAVLYNDTPVGPKTQTLDGSFNLVYWLGSGTVKCAETKPVTGDKANVTKFTPPAGSTCDANPCDGGDNVTRNCCPYGTCLSDCAVKCGEAVSSCAQACLTTIPPDAKCITGCTDKLLSCNDACPASCDAPTTCQTAMKSVNKCWYDNSNKCGQIEGEDAQNKCYFEACCAEIKAAF